MIPATPVLPDKSVAFTTDNRRVKQVFCLIAALTLVAGAGSALYGGRDWREAIILSASSSGLMLGVLWVYGSFQMFDRRYVISPDGVSLFRREHLLQHIAWSEVRSISRGHLQVRSRSGCRISFNVPPHVQQQARHAIDALYQQNRNA